MHINKVELHNFRNYENQEIKLKKNIKKERLILDVLFHIGI